jgi:hypothetical protein
MVANVEAVANGRIRVEIHELVALSPLQQVIGRQLGHLLLPRRCVRRDGFEAVGGQQVFLAPDLLHSVAQPAGRTNTLARRKNSAAVMARIPSMPGGRSAAACVVICQ